MKNISRIALFVGALFVIKLSGRAFMLSIIAGTSQSSLLPVVTMVVFFLVGAVALFVAFGERHFSNAWLLTPAIVGLCALALSVWTTSCGEVTATDLTYDAYYCTHPEMKWLMSGVCVALAAIVILRKLALRSNGKGEG